MILFFSLFLLLNISYASDCLNTKKLYAVTCEQKKENINEESLEPAFIAYRLAVKGSTVRRCRLEPTCSKFLIQSIKKYGLSKGILYGVARSQIKHDHANGILPTFLGRDGVLLISDPVENWNLLK